MGESTFEPTKPNQWRNNLGDETIRGSLFKIVEKLVKFSSKW